MRALSRRGRISNLELADAAGLSPSACLRRVQAMERAGVIRGYRAVLDAQALGRGFVAYVAVGLAEHSKTAQAAFERALAEAPEVTECHNVTGAVEYLLRIEVADLAAYKRFHTEVLGAIDQVRTLTGNVVMASPRDERG